MMGSTSSTRPFHPSPSTVAGELPSGSGSAMSKSEAISALHYTRLNLKRSEVTGGIESDKRVKGAWSTAYKLATKFKSPHEQQAIMKARDCLLDQKTRLAYNLALNTHQINDGLKIDDDFGASA